MCHETEVSSCHKCLLFASQLEFVSAFDTKCVRLRANLLKKYNYISSTSVYNTEKYTIVYIVEI